MSLYSKLTEQDLINSRNPAEQQQVQRALKIKNRISKQTSEKKLEESLSFTKKLDEIIESTKQLGEIGKKSDLVDGNLQTPVLKN